MGNKEIIIFCGRPGTIVHMNLVWFVLTRLNKLIEVSIGKFANIFSVGWERNVRDKCHERKLRHKWRVLSGTREIIESSRGKRNSDTWNSIHQLNL